VNSSRAALACLLALGFTGCSQAPKKMEQPVLWEWSKPGSHLTYPCPCADGSVLLCNHGAGAPELLLARPDQSEALSLGPGDQPDVSPAGGVAAFIHEWVEGQCSLMELDLASHQTRKVYSNSLHIERPVYSHAGDQILFAEGTDRQMNSISRVPSDPPPPVIGMLMPSRRGGTCESWGWLDQDDFTINSSANSTWVNEDGKVVYQWKTRLPRATFCVWQPLRPWLRIYDGGWFDLQPANNQRSRVYGTLPVPNDTTVISPDFRCLAWGDNGNNVLVGKAGDAGTQILTCQNVTALGWFPSSDKLAVICSRVDAANHTREVLDVLQVPASVLADAKQAFP
jgi:hypothetical protein